MKQLIFVLGSKGMLGNYVTKFLQNHSMAGSNSGADLTVLGVDRKQFDVIKDSFSVLGLLVNSTIASFKPDQIYLINCIGLIPQSIKSSLTANNTCLNTNEDNYVRINSIFPHQLAVLCSCLNITMIHITTDCVFSGQLEAPASYSEDCAHDELSIYGRSKSLGEPKRDCMIIRTSIIGEELQHKYSLLEWMKSNRGGKVNGYANHFWNGITCYQLAKIIWQIIESGLKWTGVRHIYSECVSKHQLINMINEVYDLQVTITPVYTPQKNNKTLSSIFDTQTIFNIPPLYQQIQEMSMCMP